jgi:trehalose/maltose transport system substrate-binding protein
MSEGGGRIIEANQTVSVNNPGAVRAWQRAAHWVGWISPPSVTSYEEWDAANQFENTGQRSCLPEFDH